MEKNELTAAALAAEAAVRTRYAEALAALSVARGVHASARNAAAAYPGARAEAPYAGLLFNAENAERDLVRAQAAADALWGAVCTVREALADAVQLPDLPRHGAYGAAEE